ncbi:MAG: sigma-54-dependent Fis family transcriptional regulator [Desulfobulbaceae bacterium]|nr:sigma-54-dependent Fis family transcriptional regulator [Desulfobulbaceae bacterium]
MNHLKKTQRIMIVDDEPDMLNMIQLILKRKFDCEIVLAGSGEEGLRQLEKYQPDVIVSDIKMADLDGLTLLKLVRQFDETISVVLMTGYGTIEMAVQALRDGAYDFLEKPFDKDHLIRIVSHCLERTRLLRDNLNLQDKLSDCALPHGFIGQSPRLRATLDLISRVANTDVTVLIRGESGTGKEGAARALHEMSDRRDRKMVAVNCPALPEHILESELFGYVKGAFTGAVKDKKGLFLEAHRSTILLDEVADIPLSIQTKLLRVLQEKEIQPLGQNDCLKVDVRVVALTNRDIEAMIEVGQFREDLFYRLNVVTVTMPSLETMQEDIPLLAHHFLERYRKKYKRQELELTDDAMGYLVKRKWPGNVRELQNILKRGVLLCSSNKIKAADLDANVNNEKEKKPCLDQSRLFDMSYSGAKNEVLKQFTTRYLTEILKKNKGNVTISAKQSGLERQSFQRIMRRYNIISADFKKS